MLSLENAGPEVSWDDEMRVVPWAMTLLLVFPIYVAQAGQEVAIEPGDQQVPVDEEQRLDEGLKRFGYLAGLARVCVSVSQQIALDREVLDLHSSIGRLFGTDRAFLFGSSFGYGTSVKVETKDCSEILKAYEARVTKQREAGQRTR